MELIEAVRRHFRNSGDSRISSFPLMEDPIKPAMLVIAYLISIKVVCPAVMRSRKPYNLKHVMIIYNAFLVAVSSWIFLELGLLGWFTKYSWRCEPVDVSSNKDALRVIEISWYFFILKFVEFFDTIVFVLRKKASQVTYLHVFHHSYAPLASWIPLKYGPGGYNTFFPFINSFIHIWMYLYYGLSACGPAVQKYLWWKKYLTVLQIVQFVSTVTFYVQLLVYPACQVSKPILLVHLTTAAIFLLLFADFYAKSYKTRQSLKEIDQRVKISNDIKSLHFPRH